MRLIQKKIDISIKLSAYNLKRKQSKDDYLGQQQQKTDLKSKTSVEKIKQPNEKEKK